MKLRLLQKLLLITCLSVFIGAPTNGQTINDAIDAYNKGLGLIDSDIDAAIESLEKSIEIAAQLGAQGEELKEQAEIQLPGLYYDKSVGLIRGGNENEGTQSLEKTIEVSEKYNDPATRQRAENVLHQIYARQANAAFRQNDNDEAIRLFDMALAINPQHARSHLGKGLVHRRLEDPENFKASMDLAIETALMTNEEQIAETAESTARDFFLVRAARSKGEENFPQAIEFLNTSLAYDQTFPETHFLLASIYNEQARHQDAVTSAQRAIDISNGAREETAKIYFELGKAYEALGNTAQACSAYSEAAFGNYEASAKYQMEHVLNCP